MLLRRLMGRNPYDDKWYTPGAVVPMMPGASALTTEGALKVSTVFRAVNVMAAAVASIPIDVQKRKGKRGWEAAEGDPLRSKLRLAPNRFQTSYRWRHHLVGHLVLGGNYYAHKYGFNLLPPEQQQVIPLDPARMRMVEMLPDGTIAYEYTTAKGEPRRMVTDELVHCRGYSVDGVRGVSVIDLMRENVQLAAQNRQQRTAFMKNRMSPSVVIKFPKDTEIGSTEEANVVKGYVRAFGGSNSGRPLVLGDGADISSFSISSKDAQYIESEHFLVEEFLRFTGVPGVLAGYPDKTATYAATEAFLQMFITHCVMPITENLEQELTVALYGVQDDMRVRFNLTALLRADSTARATFYRALVEMGIFTRNEVRALEGRNPLKGLDEPLTPKNMGGSTPESADQGGAPKPAPPAAPPPRRPSEPSEEDEEARAQLERARAVVQEAAARVVRKEVAAIVGADGKKGGAERFAKDTAGWRAWVADFYDRHAELVAAALRLEAGAARDYCSAQRAELLAGGVGVVGTWEANRVPQLVELAMGRRARAA